MAKVQLSKYDQVATAGDLNAGAVTTTAAVCDTWHRACFDFKLTQGGTVSQVTVELQHTRDGGTTYYTLPIVASDGTVVDVVTRAITGNDNWSIVADCEPIGEIRAVVTPTGAGAGDLVDVDLYSAIL